MKTKHTIIIEEVISEEFEVFAETREEAMEFAIRKYREGEFVLGPGDLTFKQIAIKFSHDDDYVWREF